MANVDPVIFTCAPATASPWWSVTVPSIVEVVCVCAAGIIIINAAAESAMRRNIRLAKPVWRINLLIIEDLLHSPATSCQVVTPWMEAGHSLETFVAFLG